jgi:SAM-dependent methyltransferase
MTLRKRLFARFYDRLVAGHERMLGDRRARLLRDVEGRVLELGPGTGVNFDHLPEGIEWQGVEPNPYMRERLLPRAREHGIEANFCELEGNRFQVADGSFDVVLSTLVLCSVPDLDATLAEIRRVLRPGGRFVFLEHVGAPRGTWERRIQRGIRPCWGFCADGCRPDREIGRHIEDGGFAELEMESFRARIPHVSGTARVESLR